MGNQQQRTNSRKVDSMIDKIHTVQSRNQNLYVKQSMDLQERKMNKYSQQSQKYVESPRENQINKIIKDSSVVYQGIAL